MTKPRPCASKLRLSKICRWLIALGIAKLALFGAWAADLPLPALFTGPKQAMSPAGLPIAAAPVPAAPLPVFSAGSGMEVPASEISRPAAALVPAKPAVYPADTAQAAQDGVRSAAPLPSLPAVHLPWSKEARADADESLTLAGGVDGVAAARSEAGENSWWNAVVKLTSLPVPALGERRVAHAAALDTAPPPKVGSSGPSPFTPPEQARGQSGGDGAPLPLRTQGAAPAASRPAVPAAPVASTAPVASPASAAPSTPPALVPNTKNAVSPDSPDRQQQELARREQEVLMLKQQMESRLQELQTTEKKVKGMLQEAHGVQDQKLKHLISSYTNMKAKQAAQALESLDERLAVKILAGMNPKQAGEVLTYTNPKTVAKLTELLARMQLPGD